MKLTEIGKRLRAARAYGGFKGREDFGAVVGMSPSTQQRVEDGKRALGEGELYVIEKRTAVPMWFLEGGWENYPGSVDEDARRALEDLDEDQDERRRGGERG